MAFPRRRTVVGCVWLISFVVGVIETIVLLLLLLVMMIGFRVFHITIVVLLVRLLLLIMAVGGRRRLDKSVVEISPLVRRQAYRLVTGSELDPFAFHLGLVAHDNHQVRPFLGRPEYAPHGRRPLSVALSHPTFGRRRFLTVSIHVRQHHDDSSESGQVGTVEDTSVCSSEPTCLGGGQRDVNRTRAADSQ
uniref:Uncharacterized protein n=1 Tax=Sipha flava TaxID=143950 RepID=A0A2S2QQQ9_9HEMI